MSSDQDEKCIPCPLTDYHWDSLTDVVAVVVNGKPIIQLDPIFFTSAHVTSLECQMGYFGDTMIEVSFAVEKVIQSSSQINHFR